ncbi:tetratricopeptide repeat protein, partial [candidate division WOR-3 bacterium]|nr:tetratricopeptide repeat protein [candidate division WOR-3 bacterium]
LRRPPPAGRQAEVGVSVNAGLNALLGWGWAAVFLLPFSGLVQFGPIGRLAYVPAAGLIVFAVVMADRLLRGRPAARRVAAALAVGWCVATLPFLWQRIGWWRSEAGLFRRMASDAPAYAPGHYNLGNALLTARDSAGAVAAYARAVGLDSSLAPAALNLGALLQARGDLDEAAALYRSAVSRRPDYAPAHANLGVVLHKLGDTGGAIAELRRAAGLDPANAGTAYNLAWLFRLAGEPDSARAWAERAFRLRPQDPRTRRLFEQTRRPPVTGA